MHRPAAGRPVRLQFRREKTAAGYGQAGVAPYCKSAPLPAETVVPVEFVPGNPDEHEVAFQMRMPRGRIVMEAA